MSAVLHERLRAVRARRLVRTWELRQRHHSKGVWDRLRRVLADARAAYAVEASTIEQLLAEGYVAEAVGAELQPEKTILFLDDSRLQRLPSARPIALHLDATLLRERYLVLQRFPDD